MTLLMNNGGVPRVFLIAPLLVAGLSACDGGRRTDIVVTESRVGYVPVGTVVTTVADPVVVYSPSADAMVEVGPTRYTYGYSTRGDLVAPGVIYGPGNYHDPSRPIR